MNVKIKKAGPVAIILPAGEVTRETSGFLGRAVDIALEQDVKSIVISFADVKSILSDGIRLLINLRDKVATSNKEFSICDLSKDCHFALKITNLLPFLGHVNTLDEFLGKHKLRLKPPGQNDTTGIIKSSPPTATASAPSPVVADKPAIAEHSEPRPSSRRLATQSESAPKAEPDGAKHVATVSHASEGTGVIRKASGKITLLSEEELRRLVTRHMPNRLSLAVVEYYLKRKLTMMDVKAIAAGLGEKEANVRKIASELVARGVLKSMGGDLYNYSPDFELGQKLDYFFQQWWHSRPLHSKLLGMVLAAER